MNLQGQLNVDERRAKWNWQSVYTVILGTWTVALEV
jgi:hypothetical protein